MNITATSNGRQDILIHQPFDCLFSRGVCSSTHQRNHQNPRHGPLWGEIPSQRASCTENDSISWRRHESKKNWRYRHNNRAQPNFAHTLTPESRYNADIVIIGGTAPMTAKLASWWFSATLHAGSTLDNIIIHINSYLCWNIWWLIQTSPYTLDYTQIIVFESTIPIPNTHTGQSLSSFHGIIRYLPLFMMTSSNGNIFRVTGAFETPSRALRLHCDVHQWDVMTWKRFSHYWPFVEGIHLSQRTTNAYL